MRGFKGIEDLFEQEFRHDFVRSTWLRRRDLNIYEYFPRERIFLRNIYFQDVPFQDICKTTKFYDVRFEEKAKQNKYLRYETMLVIE